MPTPAMDSLMLFDFDTKKWSVLFKGVAAYPCWSRDSRHVYFVSSDSASIFAARAVSRVAIPSGKVEEVVSLANFHSTGCWGFYLGLTPDDSLLVLKDTGAQDIVSLKWHTP